MKKIAATLGSLFALWAALSFFPTVAQTPQFPQTLNANTVVGRLGIGPGPAQSIPFATLSANLSFAPGVDQNVLNTQVVNYTITTADCGRTIQAGTGSTGFFTVTLPAVTGFAANCAVTVKNSDTVRAKALSGFPSDAPTMLYPLQSITAKIVNGAWATIVKPGPWVQFNNTTVFVDGSAGNDANDGLASGAGNAFATFVPVYSLACYNSFGAGHTLTIQVANAASITGAGGIGGAFFLNCNPPGYIATTLNLGGGTLTPASGFDAVAIANAQFGNGFNSTTQPMLYVTNGTLTCSGGGGAVHSISGFVTVSSAGGTLTFGTCTGGTHVFADGAGSRIFINTGYTISGNATFHFQALAGGGIDYNTTSTITCTGTPAFTTFAMAQLGPGWIFVPSGTVTFSGCGGVTGTRFIAQNGGSINTSGGGATYFPGNAAGTFNQNVYDSSGDPSISGTGGAGALNLGAAITFDNSGNLNVGSGSVSSTSFNNSGIIFRTQTPATLTGTSGTANSSSQIINASGTFTLTLPTQTSGQWIYIKTVSNQLVNSASSNVVPLAGGSAGTAIITVATAGKFAALQSDGTNWNIMWAN